MFVYARFEPTVCLPGEVARESAMMSRTIPI
jgi:hypothetical protein